MKNRCCLLLMLLLCLSACKQNLPPDIWEKEKMIDFFVDAQLLEAKISTQDLSKTQSDSLYTRYYEELFTYYNTTPEIWKKNIDYYCSKPGEMDEIHKEIVARLTLIESTELNKPNKLHE